MSKVIVHNQTTEHNLQSCMQMVGKVMDMGFISGEDQYCWATVLPAYGTVVYANPTRGTTHSFVVRDKV